MPKLQFNLKTLLIATCVVALPIWSARITIERTVRNMEATRSAYAAQMVAYMCVEHMKNNHQAWPKSWDELDDDFNAGLTRAGRKWEWTIDDLKERVEVDWRADLTNLEPNSVVWIKDFPDREWYMTFTNEIIASYLQAANLRKRVDPSLVP